MGGEVLRATREHIIRARKGGTRGKKWAEKERGPDSNRETTK